MQQMTKVKDVPVDIKLCPQGVVSPCPGATYMYKIMKKIVQNLTSKSFFFKLVINIRSDKIS